MYGQYYRVVWVKCLQGIKDYPKEAGLYPVGNKESLTFMESLNSYAL